MQNAQECKTGQIFKIKQLFSLIRTLCLQVIQVSMAEEWLSMSFFGCVVVVWVFLSINA